MTIPAEAPPPVGFGEALRFWLELGFISFGGPAGQVSIMHQGLVERRRRNTLAFARRGWSASRCASRPDVAGGRAGSAWTMLKLFPLPQPRSPCPTP